jgi:A/G-specific adenine glycosylase
LSDHQLIGRLKGWYEINQRQLPWRLTSDPYKIWLSEIILQQTRVDQGTPYYLRFVEAFPTIAHLADASEQKVLRLWQGLGYYSRARNLHRCAKTIIKNYRGKFPSTYETLLELPGVGPYTAAAVASIAFARPVAVVDGNVFRVLSRIFGIEMDTSTPAGRKFFFEKANQLIPSDDPGTFNQALMEFGALHCTPRKPSCDECPFAKVCVARIGGRVHLLPLKTKKVKIRARHFHYIVPVSGKNIGMKERNARDIWNGLYDFPLIESVRPLDVKKIVDHPALSLLEKTTPVVKVGSKIHLLTHQRLNIHFFLLKISKENLIKLKRSFDSTRFYTPKQAGTLPKPIVVTRFLEEMNLIANSGQEKV